MIWENRKKKPRLVKLLVFTFRACNDEFPHCYTDIKEFVLDNLKVTKARDKWDSIFDLIFNRLLEGGVILEPVKGRFMTKKSLVSFLIKDTRSLSPEDRRNYFNNESGEEAVCIDEVRLSHFRVENIYDMRKGEKYRALIGDTLLRYVHFIDIIDETSFTGKSKDGTINRYYVRNFQQSNHIHKY